MKKSQEKTKTVSGRIVRLRGERQAVTEQTMIAGALQRSKEEWERTFNAISDWVAITDLTGRILRTNRAGEDFTGIPVAEIVGQTCCKLVHGSEKHIPGCPLFKMLATGQGAIAELQVPDRSQWLMVTVDPVTDEQGKIIGAVHITRDITERKKIEETLRESEQKYKEIVELAPDGIVTVDLKGMITSCNPALSERTGYSKDDFVGRHISRVPTARLRDIPKYIKIFNSLLRGKVPEPFEFKWIHKNGTEYWGEVRISVLKRNGKTTGFQAITRDITERKKAEEAYRSLVDHSLQGLAIFQDGRVVFTNQAMAEITGYTVDEMLATSPEKVQAFVHPEDRVLVWIRHQQRLNGEQVPEHYELRGIRKDGSTCWLEIHASRIEYRGRPAIQAAYVDITERKKAEEETKKSRNLLEKTFLSLDSAIFILDDGSPPIIEDCNPATGMIFGYEKQEMLGKTTEFLHESKETLLKFQRVLHTTIDKQGYLSFFEFKMRRKNGEIFPSEHSVLPLKDDKGNRTGWISVVRDITSRKKAEQALREQKEILQTILDNIPVMIAFLDPSGAHKWVNQAWQNNLGWSLKEVQERDVLQEFYPDAEYYQYVVDFIKKAESKWGDFKTCRRDGTVLNTTWTNVPLSDGSNIGIGLDITERKKAEEEIQNLAKFPSENPYPVLRIGADGTLLYANAASTGLLRDKNSGVGRPAPPFLLSQKARGQLVKDVLEAGSVRRIEVEHAGRVFAFGAVPVVDAHYVNFYGTDITERKKAMQEARDAQQKLIEQHRHEKEHVEEELAKVRDELVRTTRLATIGQVSASIAHDLRNPLGAVRNASYFLRSRLPKDEPKASEHLEIIDQEVIKADQIITNLLEMARPRMPNKQAVDLGETVSEVFNQVRRTEAVRCIISLVPDPFVVRADPHQLRQAISNIVSNAVDAMKGDGALLVEATRSSDYDTLVFRDTGPGFAPEVRDRLFEPLVTTKATGTGLGLTICRQIVEKHGGTIDAEDCEGRGAAIKIRLPRQ